MGIRVVASNAFGGFPSMFKQINRIDKNHLFIISRIDGNSIWLLHYLVFKGGFQIDVYCSSNLLDIFFSNYNIKLVRKPHVGVCNQGP